MTIDAGGLATRVSSEIGLEFVGRSAGSAGGVKSFHIFPAHHPTAHTFTLEVRVGWRSIDLRFCPGNFSSELILAMGGADDSGIASFVSVLRSAQEMGAQVFFSLNGRDRLFNDPDIWNSAWHNMALTLRKGMLPINDGDPVADEDVVCSWVTRLAAAILALLPLESDEIAGQLNSSEMVVGLPEGAKTAVLVNRYERDRRNRAAALAIHGHVCKACDADLGVNYGSAADGLVEIHHLTPVSQLGPDYIINPITDLIPLCPNCHAVAHRRDPPYSVIELKNMIRRSE